MSMRVRDEDRGFDAFFRGLRAIAGKRATAGVQSGDASSSRDGITMGELATIHEFKIPYAGASEPRSFLRSTADENRAKYEKKLERVAKKLLKKPQSFSAQGELLKVAESMRKDIIKKIDSNIAPRLKQKTIDRKGDDLALVDTGLLRGSIKAEVK